MELPSFVPVRTSGQVGPKLWPHSGEIAEQAATVKTEMNGLTPGLDRSRQSCEMVDKADNPILCSSADKQF
jgi:hypothetical protein